MGMSFLQRLDRGCPCEIRLFTRTQWKETQALEQASHEAKSKATVQARPRKEAHSSRKPEDHHHPNTWSLPSVPEACCCYKDLWHTIVPSG